MSGKMTRYRVGKVTNQQELCLQTNKEFLMDEMEGPLIVDRLCSNFIFSPDDKERIVGTEGIRITRRELNGRLVDTLMRRGPEGFEAFLKALDETGHKAAFNKLRDYLDGYPDNGDDNSSEDEAENDGTALMNPMEADDDNMEDSVYERVENLASAVHEMKNRMDVLSMRLTRVDSDRQNEIDRLRQELHDARGETSRLRTENEALSTLVAKRSEQLKCAEVKIVELEDKIAEMEAENEVMQKNFKLQTKRLENLQTRVKQSNTKINALESSLEDQKSDHVREMDSQKRQHKRDMDSVHVKLNKEQDRRKALAHHLQEHKKETEAAMADTEVKLSQLDQKFQELANSTKNTVSTPTRSGRRRINFPDIYTKSNKPRAK